MSAEKPLETWWAVERRYKKMSVLKNASVEDNIDVFVYYVRALMNERVLLGYTSDRYLPFQSSI